MLFASWILIKLDTNGEEGLGTNPIQWRHDDVITDFTVGWLRTKNLVYTDIYMHFLFNLHASVYILTFTCIFYLIYMQVYVWSMQNIAEGLRRPERLWFHVQFLLTYFLQTKTFKLFCCNDPLDNISQFKECIFFLDLVSK